MIERIDGSCLSCKGAQRVHVWTLSRRRAQSKLEEVLIKIVFRLGCAHFNKLSSLNTLVEVSLSCIAEVVCQLPSFTRLFKVTFEEILTWLSVMTRLKQ